LLPKKVVAIGAPWVIQGNIFADNNYQNPVVVRLNSNIYRMYFQSPQPTSVGGQNIMTAVSTDGVHFSKVTNLFTGQMPAVVKLPDGQLRMYYMVSADPSTPAPNCGDSCPAIKHNLVSAISSDGLHWMQEPGIRLTTSGTGYDTSTIIHPTVILLNNGTYKLYYDGEIDSARSYSLWQHSRHILSASSTNGLNWTRDPGYRIDGATVHTYEAYSPKAVYQHGKVDLYFTTPNGIYEATSTNTLSFTVGQDPVFSPGRVPMPSGGNGTPGSYQDSFVLPVTGGNRMYFWIQGKGIWAAFQRD